MDAIRTARIDTEDGRKHALMLEELAAPLTGSEEWKALGGKTWL